MDISKYTATSTNDDGQKEEGFSYKDVIKVLAENDKYQEEFIKAISALGIRCWINETIKEPIVMLPKRFEKTIKKLKKTDV